MKESVIIRDIPEWTMDSLLAFFVVERFFAMSNESSSSDDKNIFVSGAMVPMSCLSYNDAYTDAATVYI